MTGRTVLIKLGLFLVCGVFVFNCRAGCNFQSGYNTYEYSFSVDSALPSLSLASNQQPNTPLGPIISIPGYNGTKQYYTCTPASNYAMFKYGTPMVASPYSGIYETNVPGIGIKVWFNSPPDVVQSSLEFFLSGGSPLPWNFMDALPMKAQFYVTGPVSADAGPLALNLTVEWWSNTSFSTVGGIVTNRLIITSNIPLTVKSCETPDISVDLKKHSKSDFPSVNSTSAATPFNFEIKKCSKGLTAVKYTFKPAAGVSLVNPGATNQYLTLRSGSTAGGVGVQVLYASDTQVKFNNPVKYTGYNSSLGGDYVIPMKARYIRTGEISPGSANSAVEFTMSYE